MVSISLCNMRSIWDPCGMHMHIPYGSHMGAIWNPYGIVIWMPYGQSGSNHIAAHMDSIWLPIWIPYGRHMTLLLGREEAYSVNCYKHMLTNNKKPSCRCSQPYWLSVTFKVIQGSYATVYILLGLYISS